MIEKPIQKWARRIAAVFVLILGLILVGDRLYLLWMGVGSEHWPTAEGTVQSLEYRPVGMGRSGDGWHLKVEYTYSVDGRAYTSDKLRFAKGFAGLSDGEIAAARVRYAEAAEVAVYHHPQRPSLAVLIPGADPQAWLGLVLGLALLAIAAIFWLVPTHSGRGVSSGADR